ENRSQLEATVNAATRANVSFYPVDARGLVALVPGGDASQGAPKGTGLFTGKSQTRQKEKFNDQQETLFTLAADTGGKALLDSNDLALGIEQAQEDLKSYYVVGYYSTTQELDGKMRRVRVTVPAKLQAKLEYRSSYFAGKTFGKFTGSEKERQLEEALLLGDPVTDLPIALEINHFRLTRDKFFVPVAVKLPGALVPVAKRGGADSTEFDFIGQIRDSKGKIAGNVRDTIKIKLPESASTQLAQRQIQYDTGFTLSPGEYNLRFLVRENL